MTRNPGKCVSARLLARPASGEAEHTCYRRTDGRAQACQPCSCMADLGSESV